MILIGNYGINRNKVKNFLLANLLYHGRSRLFLIAGAKWPHPGNNRVNQYLWEISHAFIWHHFILVESLCSDLFEKKKSSEKRAEICLKTSICVVFSFLFESWIIFFVKTIEIHPMRSYETSFINVWLSFDFPEE